MAKEEQLTIPSADDIDVRDIKSIEDAMKVWEQNYRASDVLGDGFLQLEDKNALVDVDLYIVKFKMIEEGSYGRFVVVWTITRDGERYRFSDGSTGIMHQLLEFAEKTGQAGGLAVPKGLVRSDYEYFDPQDDKMKPASTFYLSES